MEAWLAEGVHRWTEGDDTLICRLRSIGEPWDAIARVLGVTVGAAMAHGSRVVFRDRPKPSLSSPKLAPILRAQTLPAGHDETWGLIIRGTLLEGLAWPGPKHDDR